MSDDITHKKEEATKLVEYLLDILYDLQSESMDVISIDFRLKKATEYAYSCKLWINDYTSMD